MHAFQKWPALTSTLHMHRLVRSLLPTLSRSSSCSSTMGELQPFTPLQWRRVQLCEWAVVSAKQLFEYQTGKGESVQAFFSFMDSSQQFITCMARCWPVWRRRTAGGADHGVAGTCTFAAY